MINSRLSLSPPLPTPQPPIPHVARAMGKTRCISCTEPSPTESTVRRCCGPTTDKNPMHLHCTPCYRFMWQSEGRLLSGSD